MKKTLLFALVLLAAGCTAAKNPADERGFSLYPVFYHWTGPAPDGGEDSPSREAPSPESPLVASESHALWPFFSARRTPGESRAGLHPLWSRRVIRETNPDAAERTDTTWDFLWPLVSGREQRQGDRLERRWSALLIWFSSRRESEEKELQIRRVLFPIFFQAAQVFPGRPDASYRIIFPIWWQMNQHRLLFPFYWSEPDQSFAFFPFYGHFNNLFEIERIRFVLWPLWVSSSNRGVHSYSAPWPFLGFRTGENVWGGRLWPLVGYMRNPDEGDRAFWLWPLGQYVTFVRGPYRNATLNMFFPLWFRFTHPRREIAWYFPLYGYSKSDRRESQAWLWPLFSRTVSTKPDYTKFNVLWFFLSRQVGPEDHRRFYLLNLVGWTHVPEQFVRAHVFWPLIQYRFDGECVESGTDFKRFYALPFYYGRARVWPDGRRDYRRTLWPLASWGDEKGRRFFSALSLFPCNPGDGIARNWAPLWTLYSSVSEDEGAFRERRVLGPLYLQRRDAVRDASELNLLFFQAKRSGKTRTISLFFGLLPIRIAE